jgi:hypothetical protein
MMLIYALIAALVIYLVCCPLTDWLMTEAEDDPEDSYPWVDE